MQELKLALITAPATEPVTLSEAKSHLREDQSDEDTLITSLIVAARQMAETITRRALITQTWEIYLDTFPTEREIVLPFPPIQSITSITYLDSNGATQTLSAADYYLDSKGILNSVVLVPGANWPSTETDRKNTVTVRFVAGYGNAAAVPEAIKLAIKQCVAHWFEHRETTVTGTIVAPMPQTTEWLLWPYRVLRWL